MIRRLLCLSLLAVAPAWGANFLVGIGDDCTPFSARGCFSPRPLTIAVGDTVTFYTYVDFIGTGPHNVVADDGSFRCARGCDGEGGDGTPVDANWSFARTFLTPGEAHYHDEASGIVGVIAVAGEYPIDPAMSGSWYDPTQKGQGVFIQVLPGRQLLATWMSFNPGGDQAWLVGVGSYSGNVAIVNATRPIGGRWIPNFDPAKIVNQPWGKLTFTFTDCSHGRVDFTTAFINDWTPPSDFGSGSMNLTRLTMPAGLSCPLSSAPAY